MHDYPLKQRTIGRLLADKARRIGDKTWLIYGEDRYSYAATHEITNRYANGFAKLGIRKGDHVAAMMPNCPEFIWTIWGLGKLGAVTVPLNTAARGDLETSLPKLGRPIIDIAELASAEPVEPDPKAVHASDPQYIMYTSGT